MSKWLWMLALVCCFGCVVEPAGSSTQSIIGGELVDEQLFPSAGAILTEWVPSCTGTLVAPTVVLTAAHCVHPAFVGGASLSFTLSANALGAALQDIVEVAEVRIHPDFNPTGEPTPDEEGDFYGVGQWYDIALVILATPLELDEYGLIATSAKAQRALVADVPVDIVGFGQGTVDDQFDVGLKKRALTTVVTVGNSELLTSNPGDPQKCFGDSGGPAYVEMEGGFHVAGIASRLSGFDRACVNGAIETRVDAYEDWIAETAPEMCDELDCDDVGIPRAPSDGGCTVGGSSPGGASLWLIALALATLRRRRGVV